MLNVEQHNKFSNIWRNIVFCFVLSLFVVAGFLFSKYKSLEAVSVVEVEQIKQSDDLIQQGAGDVIVSKPTVNLKLPELVAQLPQPQQYTADRVIVKDVETGIVLYAKDAYKEWPLASMTKLMTAIVLREKPVDMGELATVVDQDLIGTHMYAGDVYSRDELWKAMLIGSINEAAVTLVQDIWGSQEAFVKRMNEKSLELGMIDTAFFEPTGLDSRNVSTPSDVAILLSEALSDEVIAKTLQTQELDLFSKQREKKNHIWNTNWILLGWIPSQIEIVAGKTGFINQSLYNFTGRFKGDDGRLVDVVIMGADTHEARFTEARDIVADSLDAYTWPQ